MRKLNSVDHKTQPQSNGVSRRKFMQLASASLATFSLPSVFAQPGKATKKNKVVWVLLRGALDSLHTVVPTFEPQYKVLRPKLSTSFKTPLLPLEKGFALHPSLVNLHQWYQQKSLLPIVAVSSGYKERSHFDGQDFIESGKASIDHDSGWLARAIDAKQLNALSVSRSIPISLRSSESVNTWYPSKLKSAEQDIYTALAALYQGDRALSENLESGLEINGLIDKNNGNYKKRQGKFIDLTKACAKLLTGEQNIDCAMLELGGWDTHNNQANRLAQKLTELDNGLAQLKQGLADEWQNTVVIIGTEFGRTAKENGTGGTDHGTASALLLAGGAINGGKVLGTWPGLEAEQLFEQRDLMPTTNSFSWIGNVLAQHWQLSDTDLKKVFPNVKPYKQRLIS